MQVERVPWVVLGSEQVEEDIESDALLSMSVLLPLYKAVC